VFSVDEMTPWRLEGSLGRRANFTSEDLADARVILASGGSEVFALALPPALVDGLMGIVSARGRLEPSARSTGREMPYSSAGAAAAFSRRSRRLPFFERVNQTRP
jgi:hypothetical protein